MSKSGKGNKLKRALAVSLLSLMLILVFTPVTIAGDYHDPPDELEGTWNSYYPDSFNATGDNSGKWGALWDEALYNFSAVKYTINKTDFGATLRDWSFSDYKQVNLRFDLSSAVFWGDFIMRMNVTNQISWWGLTNDVSVNFGGQYSIGQWRDYIELYAYRDLSDNHTLTVRLSIWDINGGTTLLPNGTIIQGYNVYWEKTYDLSDQNPDFFSNPVVATLYVEHEGSGHFDFDVTTQWYGNGTMPEIIEGVNVPEVVESYKNWITDLFDFVSGGVTFFMELLTTLGSVALLVAPYLSIILILYVVDVGFTSIKLGSFTPIGDAFMKLYELLLSAWDGAINLGMLIWDAITFWS